MKTNLSELPKVKDVYITMLPGNDYKDVSNKAIELVKSGFNQRRKMLRSSLKKDNLNIEKILLSSGIKSTLRAENLTISDWCNLARTIENYEKS